MTTDAKPGLFEFADKLRIHNLFEAGASLFVGRAPGRLDVMGGIADYSGSLVLQRPIAEATFAACHRIERPVIEIRSLGRKTITIPLETLAPPGEPISYSDARKLFGREGENGWVSYVAGLFVVLLRERKITFADGARIVISSTVPEGKGVASSAALEVATMEAVGAAFGIALSPREMALLCQMAENLVAGAPCGVMDQMTAAAGTADSLLALLCQPAELQPPVPIPDDLSFWGIDSGERQAVTGSDYASVRTAAFMGLRIITSLDGARDNYLANISPADFESNFAQHLPEEMSGQSFMDLYSGTVDPVTVVDRAKTYAVRRCTAHPIYENHRVEEFRQLLKSLPREPLRLRLGELMYESHESYSVCGLGSKGTDLIVNLVRNTDPDQGLYGARITGGGSGGTVAVLGRRDADKAIASIVEAYEKETGYRPYLFSGSSPGAADFGPVYLTL